MVDKLSTSVKNQRKDSGEEDTTGVSPWSFIHGLLSVTIEHMTVRELRAKHPRLIFDGFKIQRSRENLAIRFHITLEPNTIFLSTLTLPLGEQTSEEAINLFAFHLGLMECVSYWKAACPAELVVKAGSLNQEQIAWWHDLFLYGLGEFFYKNNIDFTQSGFFSIHSVIPAGVYPVPRYGKPGSHRMPDQVRHDNRRGDLVLLGGGKDSAVTLELLKNSGTPTRPLVLNPTRAILDNIKISGYTDPLIASRTIDPTLLKLNNIGYLNGHTPFSAYLAFLGMFVAVLHGYEHVIVSNEASASDGNVTFHGMEINHQYSKSFRFETMFRDYVKKYLTNKHTYFSFLRPLNELQISRLFSRFPQYFPSFRSCNVGSKTDSWCGKCAKCAFVYLSLYPFVSQKQMQLIFGSDLFTKPEIIGHIRDLVGLGTQKPFECVGTKEEAKLALSLCNAPALSELKKEIGAVDETILSVWNNDHVVPEEYTKLLSIN